MSSIDSRYQNMNQPQSSGQQLQLSKEQMKEIWQEMRAFEHQQKALEEAQRISQEKYDTYEQSYQQMQQLQPMMPLISEMLKTHFSGVDFNDKALQEKMQKMNMSPQKLAQMTTYGRKLENSMISDIMDDELMYSANIGDEGYDDTVSNFFTNREKMMAQQSNEANPAQAAAPSQPAVPQLPENTGESEAATPDSGQIPII